MLVDDDPDILLTYKTFLTVRGYDVDAFTDPREALTRFAQAAPNNYNLVVMDIRMPNLNGLQLYYRLKAINPNIKILFVSALDAAKEMVSILPGIGLDDVVIKPVEQEQFLYKVKTASSNRIHLVSIDITTVYKDIKDHHKYGNSFLMYILQT